MLLHAAGGQPHLSWRLYELRPRQGGGEEDLPKRGRVLLLLERLPQALSHTATLSHASPFSQRAGRVKAGPSGRREAVTGPCPVSLDASGLSCGRLGAGFNGEWKCVCVCVPVFPRIGTLVVRSRGGEEVELGMLVPILPNA